MSQRFPVNEDQVDCPSARESLSGLDRDPIECTQTFRACTDFAGRRSSLEVAAAQEPKGQS